MQSLYTHIDKTRALLQPRPADRHERQAAGLDDEDDFDTSPPSLGGLLLALAGCLLFYSVLWDLMKFLTPYIVWLVEP